jgi:ABC-type thiamin/hydroxymethylpyrimidine transport system permease subunit
MASTVTTDISANVKDGVFVVHRTGMAKWAGLFTNFKATTFGHAFILNSIQAALVTGITVEVRALLTPYMKKHHLDDGVTLMITMAVAFASAFLAYMLMWFLTGMGGGDMTSATLQAEVLVLHKRVKEIDAQLRKRA